MKKFIHILVTSCTLGALIFGPAFSSSSGIYWVEATPILASVSGTVKDEIGQPLAGAVVAVLEATFKGQELRSVRTNTEGKFAISIVPGIYHLRATADGFKPMLNRVALNREAKLTYDFALKRDDTLVQRRGDRDDYRWIGRSVPRHVLHFETPYEEVAIRTEDTDSIEDRPTEYRPSFHGMVQFVAISSLVGTTRPEANFFGTNFAVAGSLNDSVEIAIIGQRGIGNLAPQRFEAIATARPAVSHQITASIGYGQATLSGQSIPNNDGSVEPEPSTIEQVSLSAIDRWQICQPLVMIYGFDYARFIGSRKGQRESLLPRLGFQYTPTARWRMTAALTPGASQAQRTPENFTSENIQASFKSQPTEIAVSDEPLLDRSRRLEFGIERIFNDGRSSLEASAFYDIVAGHGVGVLALPLEASSETETTFERVVEAMQGTARGVRVLYTHHLSEHITASVGYSFGRGLQLNHAYLDKIAPAKLLRGGSFHLATAKLDIDFTEQSGTNISTVIRFSPSAIVFAIDPFAGRMSVYDPNINIYVTQNLPSLGLPLRWQAIVDIRNLLNRLDSVEDGGVQLVAAQSSRTLRGGVAFRW